MCIACETNINPEALDAFGERFVELLNSGATIAMMSIGYRSGLFEAMNDGKARTSQEIADKAGLNERYVREWLGVMVTGLIVECDETGQHYRLPEAHAVMLSSREGGQNLAHLTQYITLIPTVEEPLLDCFRHGGGVPYEAYPRFHEIMAMDSQQSVVDPLLDHILPLVPGLILQLSNGIEVLDVGCGRGKALTKMAQHFPNSRFTGYDLSREAIEWATRAAAEAGLTNIRFIQRDLTDFHQSAPSEQFDLITAFDAIHDQARPDHVLEGIHRSLKPDGTFLMQDIGASSNVADNREHPIGPLLYAISCSHCMTVSLAQGGLGVGAMWGEELTREFLAKAGFSGVERRTLEHDLQNYYYIVHR